MNYQHVTKFIENNPLQPWVTTKFPMCPNINLEYLNATELTFFQRVMINSMMSDVLEQLLNLSTPQRLTVLRKAVNG